MPRLKGPKEIKDEVLAILDEHLGELVEGGQVTQINPDDQIILVSGRNATYFVARKTKPGDHISIYVRRKDE